jgi:hypothetical protein
VFKKHYRRGLDDSAALIAGIDAVVGEAITAFDLGIAVSEAVQLASAAAVCAAEQLAGQRSQAWGFLPALPIVWSACQIRCCSSSELRVTDLRTLSSIPFICVVSAP